MTVRRVPYVAAGLVAFVLLSSYLGLAGRFLGDVTGGLQFMESVWGASVAADAVFTLGSMGAAAAAFALARKTPLGAILASIALNWLVYWASFLLLPQSFFPSEAGDLRPAIWFVASWGFPGLMFAALAPLLAAVWWKAWTSAGKRAGADVDA